MLPTLRERRLHLADRLSSGSSPDHRPPFPAAPAFDPHSSMIVPRGSDWSSYPRPQYVGNINGDDVDDGDDADAHNEGDGDGGDTLDSCLRHRENGERVSYGNTNQRDMTVNVAPSKKRSRRMSNSERGKLYRSRRKEYVESLEDKVEALQREVDALRLQGPCEPWASGLVVPARDRSRASFAQTVCEYFSLFQFGVPVPAMPQGEYSHSHEARIRSSRQVGFLRTLMDPDMAFGEHHGIQMLLEQWERYSMYHAMLKFDLNDVEIVGGDAAHGAVVTANATLRVRFSRLTIEKVFPHIIWDEVLVQKLIGLDVEYPVENKFYFGVDGRICRYETAVDFLGAFIRALGSVHEARMIVGHALIKEQHMIGAVEDEYHHYEPSKGESNNDMNTSESRRLNSSQDEECDFVHEPAVQYLPLPSACGSSRIDSSRKRIRCPHSNLRQRSADRNRDYADQPHVTGSFESFV